MSESEHFHQQILFEDDEQKSASDKTPQSAIIFDNKDYQAQVLNNQQTLEQEVSSEPSWLLRMIVLLVMLITGYELVDFLQQGFKNSPIITSLYVLLLTCITVLAVSAFIKEFTGLRLLKRQQTTREQASEILLGEGKIAASELCQQIHQQLTYDLSQELEEKWQQGLTQSYQDNELIEFYDITVLRQVDDKAIADIAKFSSETMMLVAISPVALLDMLIILWRNIKMIEKISGLYGLKLGYWSRLSLIKQVFKNMLYIGASELLIDFGQQALSADLLAKFSGRLAQGFGAGMLTARLGLTTIKACRPLPFQEQAPRLAHVRNSLLSQLKTLITK